MRFCLTQDRKRDERVSEIPNSSDLASSWDQGWPKEVIHEDQAHSNDQLRQPTTTEESAAVEKTIGEGTTCIIIFSMSYKKDNS